MVQVKSKMNFDKSSFINLTQTDQEMANLKWEDLLIPNPNINNTNLDLNPTRNTNDNLVYLSDSYNLLMPNVLNLDSFEKILRENLFCDSHSPEFYVYEGSNKNKRPTQEQTVLVKTDKYLQASLALCLYPELLHNYCLSYHQMLFYGYPLPSINYPDSAMIYKANPERLNMRISDTLLQSNIFHSIPHDPLKINFFPETLTSVQTHKCVRCNAEFSIENNSQYVKESDFCTYDVAKDKTWFYKKSSLQFKKEYVTNKYHVWNGLYDGLNENLNEYIHTGPSLNQNLPGTALIYSLDCEMCYTAAGLEVTKTTLVALDGLIAYESFVKPEIPIIDYNSKFSGIKAEDLKDPEGVKSLKQVQNDLLGYINKDTILIGHGLENDLRALKLMHCKVIDTSILFPHTKGLPYKQSLKSLAKRILNRSIQNCNTGHKSFEDAHTCMELILWKIFNDLTVLMPVNE